VVVVLFTAALAGCASDTPASVDSSGLPINRPVLQSDLRGLPGVGVYYPGSDVVKKAGSNQTRAADHEEPNPAYQGAILTAPVTAAVLYAWYGRWLQEQGFGPVTDYRPASQVSGQGWQRHRRLQVQVGVFDPKALATDQGIHVVVPPGGVAYEEVVVGYPPGLPKD